MKHIYIVAMAVAIAACGTHPVRCRGTLQPINKPGVTSRAAAPTGPAAISRPAAPGKPATPGSNSAVSPGEPHL